MVILIFAFALLLGTERIAKKNSDYYTSMQRQYSELEIEFNVVARRIAKGDFSGKADIGFTLDEARGIAADAKRMKDQFAIAKRHPLVPLFIIKSCY